jgi:hypothetical protein
MQFYQPWHYLDFKCEICHNKMSFVSIWSSVLVSFRHRMCQNYVNTGMVIPYFFRLVFYHYSNGWQINPRRQKSGYKFNGGVSFTNDSLKKVCWTIPTQTAELLNDLLCLQEVS